MCPFDMCGLHTAPTYQGFKYQKKEQHIKVELQTVGIELNFGGFEIPGEITHFIPSKILGRQTALFVRYS